MMKDVKSNILDPRVTWDGSIDRFKVLRHNVEVYHGQSSAVYLFDPNFQAAYWERGSNCFVDILDEVSSASEIKKDTRALNSASLSACQERIFKTNQ
jgi:hypothetical protein